MAAALVKARADVTRDSTAAAAKAATAGVQRAIPLAAWGSVLGGGRPPLDARGSFQAGGLTPLAAGRCC